MDLSGVEEPARTAAPIRVVIIDDHEMVRDGLRLLLDAQPDLDVVGEAATAAEGLARIGLTRPDVAIVDVNLPDASGIEVCRELTDTAAPTHALMLTSYADDEALFDAVIAGAAGYVLKHVRGTELVDCVRRVAAGESLLDERSRTQLLERVRRHAADPRLADLTEQETNVLNLLAEGLTNRQIGTRLYLSEKTVKNYVSSVLMKLGMSRRSEAAAFAARVQARHDAAVDPVARTRPVRY